MSRCAAWISTTRRPSLPAWTSPASATYFRLKMFRGTTPLERESCLPLRKRAISARMVMTVIGPTPSMVSSLRTPASAVRGLRRPVGRYHVRAAVRYPEGDVRPTFRSAARPAPA